VFGGRSALDVPVHRGSHRCVAQHKRDGLASDVVAVTLLAELGFDVNAYRRGDAPVEQPWETALHQSAGNGNLGLTRRFLDLGADPNLRDQRFDAPGLGQASRPEADRRTTRTSHSNPSQRPMTGLAATSVAWRSTGVAAGLRIRREAAPVQSRFGEGVLHPTGLWRQVVREVGEEIRTKRASGGSRSMSERTQNQYP
jgi:hypothetical protein